MGGRRPAAGDRHRHRLHARHRPLRKKGAAPTDKRAYGFHPLLCYLGRQALAGVLRPGNDDANTAADHIGVLVDALDSFPRLCARTRTRRSWCAPTRPCCSHGFLDVVVVDGVLLLGRHADGRAVCDVTLDLSESAWAPALRRDGTDCEGTWVAELCELDLSGWPEGARARGGGGGEHRRRRHRGGAGGGRTDRRSIFARPDREALAKLVGEIERGALHRRAGWLALGLARGCARVGPGAQGAGSASARICVRRDDRAAAMSVPVPAHGRSRGTTRT